MRRDELTELHCIMPFANLPSVQQHGILSYARATKVPHASMADEAVQARRSSRVIPGGRSLHDYSNLYIDARNPMMYVRRDRHLDFCVLRVSTDVLDIAGAIIADGNAAAGWTRFYPSPSGLAALDRDVVFAHDWTVAGITDGKRRRCAEVLVPDRIPPEYVTGCFVSCDAALRTHAALTLSPSGVRATILERMFFRG